MKYTFLDYTSDFSNQHTNPRSVMDTSAHNDVFHLHPHCEFLISLEARAQKCIVQNRSCEIDYPCLSLKKPFLIHNDYLLEKPPLDVHIVYFTEEGCGGLRRRLISVRCLRTQASAFLIFPPIWDGSGDAWKSSIPIRPIPQDSVTPSC